MTNKMLIGALAEDLYRVAIGLYKGSDKMAHVFTDEVLKRREVINVDSVKPYVQTLLQRLPHLLSQEDKTKKSEDALMVSVILRNYAQKME